MRLLPDRVPRDGGERRGEAVDGVPGEVTAFGIRVNSVKE